MNSFYSMLRPEPKRVQAFQALPAAEQAPQLAAFATSIRRCVLEVIRDAGLGHIGGDFSATDTLATLFGAVMNYNPNEPLWTERDRFILSKGHCSAALYSTLALCGFIEPAALATFTKPLSALNAHPNRRKVAGVETNTGPLGHGLPVAVGCAMAAHLRKESWKTYVILGDGEMQEGSNWEAIMFAGHKRLENLTAIVDRNRLQQGANTEDTNGLDPLDEKFAAFNWEVFSIDGHDYAGLYNALTAPRTGRPRCVIANTKKGKGVSFMENRVEWHHKVPSAEQYETAKTELGAAQ